MSDVKRTTIIIRRTILAHAALVTFVLTAAAGVLAHEGHVHTIWGTVTMAAADHVMVRDTKGKDVTVRVTKETRVKSKPAVRVEEIKAGTRVVITATETRDASMHAKTITVGTRAPVSPEHPQAPSGGAAGIEAWLKGYDAAFNARDLDKLGSFYHPDVTIYEGGGINNGWADYRDNHLGPELKAFENLQFGHSNTRVTMLPGGQAAYATSEYSIKARMGEREIDARGLETLVLVRDAEGGWRIRHSHTSSRPARRPAR